MIEHEKALSECRIELTKLIQNRMAAPQLLAMTTFEPVPRKHRCKTFNEFAGITGVYIVNLVGTDLFKIGKSVNARKRLIDLQQGIPLPLALVKFVECSKDDLHTSENNSTDVSSQSAIMANGFV